MRKEKFLKSFYALLLLVAGMSFAACSEEPIDGPGSNGNEDVTASKPGDDFYMYVNGAWHNSLPGQIKSSEGWLFDAAASVEDKASKLLEEMVEYTTIIESYKRTKSGEMEANVAYADSIYENLSERIEAAEDKAALGHIVGECIKKGYVDMMLKLYTSYPKNGDKVCFTLCPDMVMTQIVNGGGEEEEEEARKHGKHLSMGGEKYFSKTRSAGDDDFMSYVVEGLGYDPDQFLMEDSLVTVYNEMNMAPLEMLKEIVKKALETELYVYCGDDLAQKITENAVASTGQILEKQLPSLLSYPLSYYFCEKYVDDKVKAEYTEYAETMREVFAKRIEANEWLSDPTKQKALEKLNSMKFFIGEPDSWDMEALPKLRGELLLDDILETKQTRIRAIESLLGKDKRNESMTASILLFEGMPTYVYNAGHLFPANSMLMLPAFMMEPEYTSDMDAAKKYAMFYVIGHEMTHGFDLKGSTRDANGNLNNWWEPADREKFEALNDELIQQISTFEIAPGIKANGKNTVTEDVADLGGLNIAFDALNEYLKDNGATEEEIKEAQKTFFEYHAMRYRAEYTPLQFQFMLGDVHSVNMVRVNGMVQHMDSWYELYNVQEGDALYLPADKRIKIW